MPSYRIVTLVDITRTGATRSETDSKKIAQQSNFNSLLQAIGMRSNVEWTEDPQMQDCALPDPIEGRARHWIWEFTVEREDVFLSDHNPVALLEEDLHNVPIIPDLDATADIHPAAFQTKGKQRNIWIYII